MSDDFPFELNDEIVYTGPEDLPAPFAAPSEIDQPYQFRHMTFGGTLSCLTKFNARKRLSPDHPANNPDYWKKV